MPELLSDLAASWRRDLRVAGKAERTITLYLQSVRYFSDWLVKQERAADLEQLTKANISAWISDLNDRNAPNTVLTRFRGMRRFVRWLVKEGELAQDPMRNLEQPKANPAPVPVLTDEEISALFKTCQGASFRDRRDHAILRVLFDTGIRISECAGLTVGDVDLSDGIDTLLVMGKGARPRVVPFGSKTGRALDRYMRARRSHKHAGEVRLWLGQRGGLSMYGITDILEQRAAQAGVKGVHAHRFRHTFAHRWLASGGQERDLMRLTGWTSTAMLARYGSSAADERAREAHRRAALGDRL